MRRAYDHTLQAVNTEFETTASCISKIFTNVCFHHVYSNNVNTSRTTWKHIQVPSVPVL